jgi:hypothetical protein
VRREGRRTLISARANARPAKRASRASFLVLRLLPGLVISSSRQHTDVIVAIRVVRDCVLPVRTRRPYEAAEPIPSRRQGCERHLNLVQSSPFLLAFRVMRLAHDACACATRSGVPSPPAHLQSDVRTLVGAPAGSRTSRPPCSSSQACASAFVTIREIPKWRQARATLCSPAGCCKTFNRHVVRRSCSPFVIVSPLRPISLKRKAGGVTCVVGFHIKRQHQSGE